MFSSVLSYVLCSLFLVIILYHIFIYMSSSLFNIPINIPIVVIYISSDNYPYQYSVTPQFLKIKIFWFFCSFIVLLQHFLVLPQQRYQFYLIFKNYPRSRMLCKKFRFSKIIFHRSEIFNFQKLKFSVSWLDSDTKIFNF